MASTANSIPTPSRRGFFASAIVAGACAGSMMGPQLDGALLDACAAALFKGHEIGVRAGPEDWSDDRIETEVDTYYAAFEVAVDTPASSREGLIAKARLVEHEFNNGAREDTADRRILRSLLRDLTTGLAPT